MKYKQTDHVPLVVQEVKAAALENPGYWVERIVAGLPVAEFDALREMLGLSVEEMAGKIGISVATLSRRRAKTEPLDRDHSDRLMRYARLYWLSIDFFNGDAATGRDWLKRPARALAGHTPLDFAETEMGAREVEDLIGRLEHGVYV
jgi:putative toxin-antitoxin system antitoxin component (TIGR02293 family)